MIEKQSVTLTAMQVRDLMDHLPPGADLLETALDLAQGEVFTGQSKRAIVEIIIEGVGDV